MNDPILAPGGEHGQSAAAAAWPRTVALFRALVFCALAAALASLALAVALPESLVREAEASHFPVVDTANTGIFDCDDYGAGQNLHHADPFADELGITDVHQHFFRENRAFLTYGEDVTEEQLFASTDSTCGPSWATSLEWNPITRDPANGIHDQAPPNNAPPSITYYFREGIAAPSALRHFPPGAKLLARNASKITFNCTPGDNDGVSKTPPYGCPNDVIKIRIKFPQCWDQAGKNPGNFRYPVNGRCPSGTVPVPEISANVSLETPNPLRSPLEISSGHDTWAEWQSWHVDVWLTMQGMDAASDDGLYHPPQGFREWIEACVMKPENAPRYSYCLRPDSHEL